MKMRQMEPVKMTEKKVKAKKAGAEAVTTRIVPCFL